MRMDTCWSMLLARQPQIRTFRRSRALARLSESISDKRSGLCLCRGIMLSTVTDAGPNGS